MSSARWKFLKFSEPYMDNGEMTQDVICECPICGHTTVVLVPFCPKCHTRLMRLRAITLREWIKELKSRRGTVAK